jgi:long-subunit acyl-CoA synthetase (AMP-forming)
MFGQSMASNIPPMVRGTVIFTRSFNPHDVVRLIKTRRVSVLVCVPKILDVLRDHIVHTFPEAADPPAQGISIPGRWWTYRRIHSALGLKFWAFVVGAAPLPPDVEEFLAAARIRRHSRLRPDRDRADRHAESSLQDQQGLSRHGHRGRRDPHRRRRRDPGSW